MEETRKTNDSSEMTQLFADVVLVVGYLWRAVKRQRILAIVVSIAILSLSIALLQIMPRTYDSRARILMNPSRTLINVSAYEGRETAAELMRSRENLLAVIDEIGLKKRWESTRTPIGQIKDHVTTSVFGKKSAVPDEKTLTEILVYTLGEKIQIWVHNNVLQIIVEWHDSESAYLIVDCLVRRFLDEQYRRESAKYLVEIANYEKKLEMVKNRVKQAEDRVKALDEEAAPKDEEETTPQPRRISLPAPEPKTKSAGTVSQEEIDDLQRALTLKRREMSSLQDSYIQRLGDAKNRLQELKLTMGPRHPEVIKSERLVSILSKPPAALKDLKREEELLAANLNKARRGAASTSSSSSSRRRWRSVLPRSSRSDEPSERYIEEKERREVELRDAKSDLGNVFEALSNARLEYEAGKSALDLRFKVSQPPQKSAKPIKPNPKKIIAAAIIAGLFLGMFLAVFVDIKSGILWESWQLSRIMRIPVLGEMDEP